MRDWLGNFRSVQLYRSLGPERFWALMVGITVPIVAWAALGMWLESRVGWPDAYGFHCHGKCMIEDLWHSPSLLGGNFDELELFAWIWTLPAAMVAAVIYAIHKKRSTAKILEMNKPED